MQQGLVMWGGGRDKSYVVYDLLLEHVLLQQHQPACAHITQLQRI
jgi:hypothetical protein